MSFILASQSVAYGAEDQAGSLKVTVYHADQSIADSNDFFAPPDEQSIGYFSLNDDEGNLVDAFKTCNESETACEIQDLPIGDYSAAVSLAGSSSTVGGQLKEYSESLSIEEGATTELAITIDYGYVKINVIHSDGEEFGAADFVSLDGLVEGYYSIYDENGEFLVDSSSCNLSESCELTLGSGIYEARVAPPSSLTPFSVPFEVADNIVTEKSIVVEQGSFKVSVFDSIDNLADASAFSHPIGYRETGWFAAYDSDGFLVLDGESCNISDSCEYPYDSGTLTAYIRKLPSHLILSCTFEIADNDMTPVEFYLSTNSCNQMREEPSDEGTNGGDNGSPSDSGNGGTIDGNNNSSNGGSSNSNAGGIGSNSTVGVSNQSVSPGSLVPISKKGTVSIRSHSHFVDLDGTFHVVGEVQNTSVIPVSHISITGVFYSNISDFLAIKRGYSPVDLLRPGERSPFEIVIKDVGVSDKIANYTLTATYANSTQAGLNLKPAYLGINITRQFADSKTGLYHMEGKVFNYAGSIAHFVQVIATYYDINNKIIYLSQKYISSHQSSDTNIDFEIVFAPANASRIASVYAIVQSDEFSMVPSKFLVSPIRVNLDSGFYDNGMVITVNGTIGKFIDGENYAVVQVIWPDGNHFDRELARVSPLDGSYTKRTSFYSLDELRGKTFIVSVTYNSISSEKSFVFS